RLATDAIPSGVRLGVEVVRRALEDTLDQRTDADLVLFARGTHEVIVRDAERCPRFLKSARDLIDLCLRGPAFLGRGLRDLLTVLVHPGDEQHLLATETVVPGQDVSADLLKGMPQVRVAVGVVDRGGDIVLVGHVAIYNSCQSRGSTGQSSFTGPFLSFGLDAPEPLALPPSPLPLRRPRRRRSGFRVCAGGAASVSTVSVRMTSRGSGIANSDVYISSGEISSDDSSASSHGGGVGAGRPATSPLNVSSGMVRKTPSAFRNVTDSRNRSTVRTFSSPTVVMTMRPSFGKRRRVST